MSEALSNAAAMKNDLPEGTTRFMQLFLHNSYSGGSSFLLDSLYPKYKKVIDALIMAELFYTRPAISSSEPAFYLVPTAAGLAYLRLLPCPDLPADDLAL